MPTTTSSQGTQFRTGPRAAQDDVEQGDAGIATSLSSTVTTSAPGLGVSMAFLTAPPPGTYKARIVVIITGTAETQLSNLALKTNGVTTYVLPTLTGLVFVLELPRLDIASGNASLTAVAAATAGSFYTCSLTLTRVE